MVKEGVLRIPRKPKDFIYIPLKTGDYQRRFLEDPTLKRGSVTLTADTVVVAFSRDAEVVKPMGKVAFDTNELSVDGVVAKDNTLRSIKYDVRKAVSLRHGCFENLGTTCPSAVDK